MRGAVDVDDNPFGQRIDDLRQPGRLFVAFQGMVGPFRADFLKQRVQQDWLAETDLRLTVILAQDIDHVAKVRQ